MHARRLVVAALLLLGLAVVTVEESYVHSDDGCAVETHCTACLLQLGTTGVLVAAVSLPPVLALVDRVAVLGRVAPEQAASRAVASRGPPTA